MNKFKKILLMSGIAVSIGALSACNKQADNQSQADEMLTVPEYQTQELTQAVENYNSTFEIVDGYEVIPMDVAGDTFYAYRPYIQNRVRGVYYSGDDWEDMAKPVSYASINCPDGAEYVVQAISGDEEYWSFGTQPRLGFNKKEDKRELEKNPLHIYRELFSIYGMEEIKGNLHKEIQNGKCTEDIQCITVALYEDFYEKRPEMNLKVYGISNELWEQYLGNDMIFSYNQHKKFLNTCKDNGYSECTLLGEKAITETGVYYVDIKELSKQGDFAQYILTVDFSESMEYTYRICCDDTYNVEEKDVKLYEAWKEQHKEQFIAGGEN